jgi:hypothetical protein
MKRFKHNLSHYKLLTCDMGELIPVGTIEVLPGDTFDHSANVFIRVSPLAAPVMHPVHVRVHHFYIPNRLVWATWEDFITGGSDGLNADTIPTVETDNTKPLFDHLYSVVANTIDVSALPLYGYNAVYNEYYRDQDLVTAAASTNEDIHKIA